MVKSIKAFIFHPTLLSVLHSRQADITSISLGENDTILIECGEVMEVTAVIADYLLTMVLYLMPFDTCRTVCHDSPLNLTETLL
jgi:hypothetical protein